MYQTQVVADKNTLSNLRAGIEKASRAFVLELRDDAGPFE